MGYAHTYKCKNCGQSGAMYLSVGMMYPRVCDRIKRSAINGEMGKTWQKFVIDHPNGMFDCEKVVFSCSCGGWRVAPKLDYYVANDKTQVFSPYFTGDNNYDGVIRHSQHRCPKCRKNMRVISDEDIPSLRCPHCAGDLEFFLEAIMWD